MSILECIPSSTESLISSDEIKYDSDYDTWHKTLNKKCDQQMRDRRMLWPQVGSRVPRYVQYVIKPLLQWTSWK